MNLVEVDDLVIGPAGGGPAVVDGVSFTVPRGGALALVGRSGSGKTTTALSLLGRLRPGLVRRGGHVRVDGRDPFDPAGARQLLGRVVSYLGQDPAATLTPSRRIGSLIAEAAGMEAARMDAARMDAARMDAAAVRVEELLDAVQLPTDRAFQRRRPHELSGGQAQRAALAVALAPRPGLLVLDEPTSGLDPVLAVAFRDLVAGVLRDGTTAAVLVSHDPWLVNALADEVLEMSAGRVTATRSPRLPRPLQAVPTERHTAAAPRLSADGLTAGYGRRTPVLRDVSFTVPAGGCLAVVGPSGSGKSTLARVLAGLLPGAGRIELDGARLAARARDRTAEQRRAVQLVAQDSHGALNPRESVGRALLRPLSGLRGLDRATGMREARALLQRVELPEAVLHRRPHALSGGERQRVNLARALAAGPTVLLCDEITSALDPELSIAIADLLARLGRELGVAVLLITHELPIAARIADEIAVLDAGRIVEHGPTAAVLGDPAHDLTRALVAAQERSDGRDTSRNSRPA